MSLAELIKIHGQAARFRHYSITNGVPLVVITEDNGHYFVKFDTDRYATITPKEAESGWDIHVKKIPTRVCVWTYLNPDVDLIHSFKIREGVNPWECKELKSSPYYTPEMDDLKYWHRCDDEDVVIMETR